VVSYFAGGGAGGALEGLGAWNFVQSGSFVIIS